MLDIGKAPILCVRVLGIIHVQDMHNHSIYDLDLAIWGWKAVDLVSLVSNSD
jgi:hypothetical protein